MDSDSISVFISSILTILVFGFAGFKLADRFSPPKSALWWIVLVIATSVTWVIGVSIRIISIFGATLYMNSLLGGLGLGFLLGLIVRSVKLRTRSMRATS